jgi:solute:Na+ symporter, SSS family
MLITFGAIALVFIVVVIILQLSYKRDRDFTDFTVAGRSFGGFAQAMAFFNTYQPGTVFLGALGFIISHGAVGMVLSTLVAPVVMFLMAQRVWTWGAANDLKTQPELMALRFQSRAVRIITALIGIAGLFPWMVLGMQSLGAVFYALSLGHLGFTTCVALGVAVMTIRQFWTIRMGMRGIIISDLFQGVIAYIGGSVLIIWLIVWLLNNGASLASLPAEKLSLPDLQSPTPLLFFSLNLLPILCSLCWPDLFVRLYTGSGVDSVKRSSAYCAPLALVFVCGMCLLGLLAGTQQMFSAAPETAWFALGRAAGGVWLLAAAGTIVFAASMGNIDATVQSCGAQVANDIIAPLRAHPMSDRSLTWSSQAAMLAITFIAAALACLPIPSLFNVALLAFQIMVQLSVPLYFGIFSRFGGKSAALASMSVGILIVAVLQFFWPLAIPWAFGLTSGAVALLANLAAYIGIALVEGRTSEEGHRLNALFSMPACQR